MFGPLRALLFFDAGQAFLEGESIEVSEFRISTGGELRFIMPVLNVPFRLIYAWNPNRDRVPAPHRLQVRGRHHLLTRDGPNATEGEDMTKTSLVAALALGALAWPRPRKRPPTRRRGALRPEDRRDRHGRGSPPRACSARATGAARAAPERDRGRGRPRSRPSSASWTPRSRRCRRSSRSRAPCCRRRRATRSRQDIVQQEAASARPTWRTARPSSSACGARAAAGADDEQRVPGQDEAARRRGREGEGHRHPARQPGRGRPSIATSTSRAT